MSKKNISLKESYVNNYKNIYKNGLQKHNNINKQNSFTVKTVNQLKNDYDSNLYQNTFQHNKKVIQNNMRSNEHNKLPSEQKKIFIQKGYNKKTQNFLDRNNLNIEIFNNKHKKLLKDNRLVMNEIDNSYKNFNKEFDQKMKQNEKLIKLRSFNYNNNSHYKPIQNKERTFFDFKPENTRLTFNSKNKNDNKNKKILSYQELTKEFNKPMFS